MKKSLLGIIFLALTLIFGTIYLVAQQVYRQSANDPQIEIAQDAAASLDRGVEPMALVSGQSVDPSLSLAPFLIIYDKSGRVALSQVKGAVLSLPAGVLRTADNRQNVLTWQPRPGLRIAAVVVRSASGDYVLAGRSLREVERREDALLQMVALAWAITLIVCGALLGWSNRSRH